MRWEVELSDEVRDWYLALSPEGKAITGRVIERLAARGSALRMPHAKPLGQGLHELRFMCEGQARRVTYIFEPERMVITLTTFRKQRQNERREVLRARRAQAARATQQTDRRATKRGAP